MIQKLIQNPKTMRRSPKADHEKSPLFMLLFVCRRRDLNPHERNCSLEPERVMCDVFIVCNCAIKTSVYRAFKMKCIAPVHILYYSCKHQYLSRKYVQIDTRLIHEPFHRQRTSTLQK